MAEWDPSQADTPPTRIMGNGQYGRGEDLTHRYEFLYWEPALDRLKTAPTLFDLSGLKSGEAVSFDVGDEGDTTTFIRGGNGKLLLEWYSVEKMAPSSLYICEEVAACVRTSENEYLWEGFDATLEGRIRQDCLIRAVILPPLGLLDRKVQYYKEAVLLGPVRGGRADLINFQDLIAARHLGELE